MADLSILPPHIARRVTVTPSGCWRFGGYLNPRGYGLASFKGRTRSVHRAVYELAGGDLATEATLDHRCHDPNVCGGGVTCPHRACCNPAHLRPMTIGGNTLAGNSVPALNLLKKRCPAGHPYDIVDRRGWRSCRTCKNNRQNERRRRVPDPAVSA